MYSIKLEKFEGPLDLLLELIEKEKMNITEVSLSKVANEYLEQFNSLENVEPAVLADFLQIAAQLILLKSRTLLPDLEVAQEDEISASELKARLMEYKRYKDAAIKIKEMYNNNSRSFEKIFLTNKKPVFYPGKNLDINKMQLAISNLIEKLAEFEKMEKDTIRETISIKEKISYIRNLISKKINIKFNELLTNSKSKTETIVGFLALLELVKQRALKVDQDNLFGDIIINTGSTHISQ